MTDRHQGIEVRRLMWGELAHRHTAAPGLLRLWSNADLESPRCLKEVIAIIRPARWQQTKARMQRLRLPAFTHHRVLGRGRERGLRYLPRDRAAHGAGIRYLPKRLISWVVEGTQVEPLVQAIIEVNRTGRLGDGKVFVLPVEEAVRVRTMERGMAALRSEHVGVMIMGTADAARE